MNLKRRLRAYVKSLSGFEKFALVVLVISATLLVATFVNLVVGGLGHDFGVTVPVGYPLLFALFAMTSLGRLRRHVGR